MSEKRFRVHELVKTYYSEIGEYIDENHTDRPLRNDEVVELLNELAEENEQLKDIINRLFNTITELDWAKEEYCNALIKILGEENDVDKAKQRIKEFLE